MNSCINTSLTIKSFVSEVTKPLKGITSDFKQLFIVKWSKFYNKRNLSLAELQAIYNNLQFMAMRMPEYSFILSDTDSLTAFVQLAKAYTNGDVENDPANGLKEAAITKDIKEDDRTFIWLNYGTSVVKSIMELRFRKDMVESMYVSNTDFITTEEQLNANIRERLELLWRKIQEYAQYTKSDINIQGTTLFDAAGNYTGVLETFKNELNALISKNVSFTRLDNLYRETLHGNTKERALLILDVYNAWFLLKNFDRMLATTFKNGIRIRRGQEKSFINARENKYTFGDTSHLQSNWRDESKDYDESKEFGDIPRNIIITRQLYDRNGKVLENLHLQFSHVTSVIPKIWDLYYNLKVRNTKLSDIFGIGDATITSLLNNYKSIYGDIKVNLSTTLGQLIALAGLDASIYYPILFGILSTNKVMSELESYGFNEGELGVIKTLDITMFNPSKEGSLAYIHNNTKHEYSYFSYLNQMLDSLNKIILREYYETDDGNTEIRTLFDKSIDDARYNLENLISANFTAAPISITIEDKNKFTVDYDEMSSIKFENGKIYTGVYDMDGEIEYTEVDLSNPVKIFDSLSDLISLVTTVDLNKDSKYRKTLDAMAQRNSDIYIRLLNFVGSVLYNEGVLKLADGKDYNTLISILNKYYNSIKPRINKDLSINLVDSIQVPTLRELASIVLITDGRIFDPTVRDGEGSQISTALLSMLATNLKLQYELVERQPKSATQHFSIFDLFSGVDFLRDYKGKALNKNALKFNHTEVLTACLLDYFNGLQDNGSHGTVKTMAFLASIISDKSRLIRTNINANTEVTLNGVKKRFGQLTTAELMELTRLELYKFYENVRNDVNTRLSAFSDMIANIYPETDVSLLYINGEFNFERLNEIINEHYIDSTISRKTFVENFLHNIIVGSQSPQYVNRVLNTVEIIPGEVEAFGTNVSSVQRFAELAIKYGINFNPFKLLINNKFNTPYYNAVRYELKLKLLEGILLREILDYSIDKNGYLSENESLYNQIYDDVFWDTKNTEMVNDFIFNDCAISTADDLGLSIGGNAYNNLLNNNEGWIHGGNLAVASITMYNSKGEPYEKYITSKNAIYNIDSKHSYENMIADPDFTLAYRSSKEALAIAQQFGLDVVEGVVSADALNVENPNFNIQLLVGALGAYLDYNRSIQETKKQFSTVKEAQDYLSSRGIDYSNFTEAQKYRFAAIEKIKEGKGASVSSRPLKLTINPSLVKFNVTDFFISQEFMLTSVGTHLNHPGSTDAKRWMQLVKRNVSLSASKHKASLNLLNGLNEEATVCVIKDDKDFVYNIAGKTSTAKPWDGSMFVNGVTSYLENNSLGDSKGGETKKEFAHSKFAESGAGVIVKTAGYPMTCNNLRNSGVDYGDEFMTPSDNTMDNRYILNKKMLSRDVSMFMINPEDFVGIDITKDFLGNDIWNNEDFYFYDPSTQHYYRFNASDIEFNDGITTITYSQLDGTLENGVKVTKQFQFRTAYDIWRAFGAEWSCKLLKNQYTDEERLIFSEDSFKNLTTIVNSIGEITKEAQVYTSQSQVNQYLKKSLIDFAVTEGAIKQGATNINSTAAIFDQTYPITTFKMSLHDFGIQLDAEHESDDSVLAMMTQVVNALGARGYTAQQANRVYNALYNIAIENIGDIEQGLKSNDSEKFKDAVIKLIVDSLIKPTSNDGNLLHQIAQGLDVIIKLNSVTLENAKGLVLIDHPSVFNKLVSNIASSLTKKCVSLQFPGLMCVLNPSNRLTKIYNGHLRSYYKGRMTLALSLIPPKVISPHRVILGATYQIWNKDGTPLTDTNGNIVIEKVDRPSVYREFKNKYKDYYISEYTIAGRDLASSNAYFKVENLDYCLWDLDVIEELSIETDPIRIKQLRHELQYTMDVLSGAKSGTIRVEGNNVVPTNVEITAFEAILPMIFKTQFGLEDGDDIKSIEDDKFFFLRRAIENGDFNCPLSSNHFDIEINVGAGKNVYLLTNFRDTIPEGLHLDDTVEKRRDLKGDWWVLDENGENRLKLSSENDAIYIDENGNEVIYTENPTFFINNIQGVLTISDSVTTTDKDIEEFFALLENKQADGSVNKRTKGLLESLRKGTDIKADIANGWKARNEFIQSLKDDLAKGTLNMYVNPITFLDFRRNRLVEYYLNKHASFLKSLKTLVARIPAQSHQSFMAMKVVGFSGNINNAMVSIMQLWLQGSDFDIDKASFLGYKFKNGTFVEWSPFMKLSTALDTKHILEASENLPFPTGEISVIDESDMFPEDIIQKANSLIGKNGKINTPKTVEEMNTLVELFNWCEENGVYKGCPALVQAWNEHNTYFKNNKGLRVTDALVNFISTNMYNISNNPRNWIQGQTPIDDPSDDIKKIAVTKPMEIKTRRYSPGNIMSKIEMLRLTITGKENTGIMASSMKVFEAISQYYYNVLNGNDLDELEKLVFLDLVTKRIKLVANAYTDKVLTEGASEETIERLQQLQQLLNEVDNTQDAFVVLSAMLSLSTDNAKDPTLSKINANPEMIGLYTAGIMEGMSIEDLVEVVLSPTGQILNNIQRGNVFAGKIGQFGIQGAVRYINEGPKNELLKFWHRFNLGKNEALKKVLGKSSFKDFSDWLKADGNYYETAKRIIQLLKLANNSEETTDITVDKDGFKEFLESLWQKEDVRVRLFIEEKKLFDKTSSQSIEDILIELNDIEGSESLKKKLRSQYYQGKNRDAYIRAFNNAKLRLSQLEDAIKYVNGTAFDVTNPKITNLYDDYTAEVFQQSGKGYNYMWDLGSKVFIAQFAKTMREWNLYRKQVNEDIGEDGIPRFEKLKFLAQINGELSLLQPLTKLNLGLLNSPAELVDFIDKFETIISKRARQAHITTNKMLDAFKLENRARFGEDNLRIDLNAFLHDENYQRVVLETYDSIKCMINPLRVVLSVQHYKGYLTTMNALYKALSSSSGKYKFLDKCVTSIFPNLRLSGKDKINALRRSQQFYDLVINNEFLARWTQLSPIRITSGKYYDLYNNLQDVKGEHFIDLKTPQGRATFKYWMEKVVFPTLKTEFRGLNKFIDDIRPTKQKGISSSKNPIICYTLPINMLPKRGSEEELKLINYKNELAALNYTDIDPVTHKSRFGNLFNLMYIYNTIVFNGLSNRNSWTKLIEELKLDDYEIIRQHQDVLSSHVLGEAIEYDQNDYVQFVSPEIQPQFHQAERGFVLNWETGKYVFVLKILTEVYNDEEMDFLQDELDLFGDDVFEYSSGKLSFEQQLNAWGYEIVNTFNRGSDFVNEFDLLNYEKVIYENEDGTFKYNKVSHEIQWTDSLGNVHKELIKDINKRFDSQKDWFIIKQLLNKSGDRNVKAINIDIDATLSRLRAEQELKSCNI